MMFEQLAAGLQEVFEVIGDKRTLTEADIQGAVKDMRRAMLEADVSFTLVKDFVATFMARATGPEVLLPRARASR